MSLEIVKLVFVLIAPTVLQTNVVPLSIHRSPSDRPSRTYRVVLLPCLPSRDSPQVRVRTRAARRLPSKVSAEQRPGIVRRRRIKTSPS